LANAAHHKVLLGFHDLLDMSKELLVLKNGNIIIGRFPRPNRLTLQNCPIEVEYVRTGPGLALPKRPLTSAAKTTTDTENDIG